MSTDRVTDALMELGFIRKPVEQRNEAVMSNDLVNFSKRLREVREQIGLSQVEFAHIGGVTMRSQRNYEKAERKPDVGYLLALAAASVDITYLLIGRSGSNQ